jgi:chaperonin GroEL
MAILSELKAELEGSGDELAGVVIVDRALREPTRRLAANAGVNGAIVVEEILSTSGANGWNANTMKIEDLRERGIIDPTKVVRVALEHAASIAGLLLTTDALVTESPSQAEDEPSGPSPPGS